MLDNPVRWAMGAGAAAPALALTLALAGPPQARAAVLLQSTYINAMRVQYEVVLPDHYDPGRAYPAILGFAGGPQTIDMVDGIVKRYFRDEAQRRGYIVVVPVAEDQDGQLFFQGGEQIFPQFLKRILSQYHIEGGKFHAAGASNGGISAFDIAALYPQYFLSITAFPGYLPKPTAARIAAISALCIHMFVGELDPLGWQPAMQAETRVFQTQGMSATYTVEKGQPHRLETLAGAHAGRLFDLFDQAQHGCGAAAGAVR
jgi:poly(3-hydroxybutyrate) depolymerase